MKLPVILLVAAAVAVGCTESRSGGESVAMARLCLDEGHLQRSQSMCDALLADSVEFESLSVSELCQLADVYMALDSAQRADGRRAAESYDAQAARCVKRARALDPDSVEAVIAALPRESATRLMMIYNVSTYLEIPRDSLAIEEPNPDSL